MKSLFSLFFTLLLFASITSVTAQIQKNTWLLGGNLTGSVTSRTNSTSYNINVNPQVGYFIGDNLSLGIAFPIDYTNNNYRDSPLPVAIVNNIALLEKSRQINLSISPFIRKYFSKHTLKPFLQGSLLYSTVSNTSFYTNSEQGIKNQFDNIGLGIGAGLNYFISDKVALEAVLDYSRLYRERLRFQSSETQLRFGLVVLLSRE